MSHRRSGSVHRRRTDSDASSSALSGPPSPTFSATTNASQVLLGAGPNTIITRRDLRQAVNAYEDLVQDCQAYREALIAMSNAASRFASTFERCSRLKGVDDPDAIGLQAAGGLHHLMANQWQILSMTLQTGFEDPLQQELAKYKRTVSERSAAYERTLVEKSKLIKKTEAESVETGRRKMRDLQSFRRTLAALQAHVDDLDRLKTQHYQDILEHESKVWSKVMDKSSLVVRSSLDVFDKLSSKASDPMLEPLMQAVLDPFDAYGPSKSEDQIFSILAPLSIASNSNLALRVPSPSPPNHNSHLYPNGADMGDDSIYEPRTPLGSHSWGDNPTNEWSNYRSHSPSSGSMRRFSVPNTPPRTPSSPPSTGTLRGSDTKPRPSIKNVEDVLSATTIKGLEPPSSPLEDLPRRDTIIAPRPQLPKPEGSEDDDETTELHVAEKKHTPPSKKSGFGPLTRFISPSSAAAGVVDKGSG